MAPRGTREAAVGTLVPWSGSLAAERSGHVDEKPDCCSRRLPLKCKVEKKKRREEEDEEPAVGRRIADVLASLFTISMV